MRFLAPLWLLALLSVGVCAQPRHALVIGNQDYRDLPRVMDSLNNVRAVRDALVARGFVATLVTDASRERFHEALSQFVRSIRPRDVALFYYAGHAVQIRGENYLLPIEASQGMETGVRLDEVLNALETSGAGIRIIVLDAYGAPPVGGRSPSGLAPVIPRPGTFVAFSGEQARTLADNPRFGQSLFTSSFLREIAIPGLTIDQVFRNVRESVWTASAGRQAPMVASSGNGNFYFSPPTMAPAPPGPPPDAPPAEDLRFRILKVRAMIRDARAKPLTSQRQQALEDADLFIREAENLRTRHPEDAARLISRAEMLAAESMRRPEAPPVSAEPRPVDSTKGLGGPTRPSAPRRPTAPVTTTLERYPTIEAPPRVTPENTFNVLVSLTRDLVTPEARASRPGSGSSITKEGRIAIPVKPAEQYKIDVVLMARDFEVAAGADSGQIELDKDGDSTPARFQLRARPGIQGLLESDIQVTFWHEGRYLARATRPILIVGPSDSAPSAGAVPMSAPLGAAGPVRRPGAASGSPTEITRGATAMYWKAEDAAPDMTVFLIEDRGGSRPSCQIVITSRNSPPAKGSCTASSEMAPWLEEQYRKILASAAETRSLRVSQPNAPERIESRALLEGFGRELYRRFAPELFQRQFWAAVRRLGKDFRSIQIFTDNPLLPWELMVPVDVDGKTFPGFLGTEFQTARWHIESAPTPREVPPNRLRLQKVTIIAPRYQGAADLPNQRLERESLRRLLGSDTAIGRFADVAGVVASPPAGIVHFIGHGTVQSGPGVASYAIQLEDRSLDLMTWRGLVAAAPANHPLYFLNACDVGQSSRVVHFVDGWAPAVLDSGASGFIGGIWPVSDAAAADLATRFYSGLADDLQSGSSLIPELLRLVRRRFFETQDPTYLAYVFYGDVRLRVEK